MKQNCWEKKGCGREEGGAREHELGPCPATTETTYDGIHGGKNAGRCCWVVAGSLCNGKPQGTFVQKTRDCFQCDFYKDVFHEEGDEFSFTMQIVNER